MRWILFFLLFPGSLCAQERRFTVSGTITDKIDGESLIGANVRVVETRSGVAANAYGYYALTLPSGTYTLQFSFMGYATQEIQVQLTEDRKLNVALEIAGNSLDAVVVSSKGKGAHVTDPVMSVEHLSAGTIKKIPAMMGEVDIIKAIQLLPGVQSTSEGSSGFSVRGGSHDQNLVLLDEATVYSASHLMGFFSVFNNDAVKDVVLYKGDIPATFGGRLSSLLDVRTKDGNNRKFAGTGGIGLISSRLTLEGPIAKERSSFLVSGRRTYADMFLPLANNANLRKSTLYFYDLNAKLNYRFNDNNRLYLAAYHGRDKFATNFAGMDFGNTTVTLRWNHVFTPRLFSNFTAIASSYSYYMQVNLNAQLKEEWKSKMEDYGLKADFTWHLASDHDLKFGYQAMYHVFIPGQGGGVGEDAIIGRISFPHTYALEHALYTADETSIGSKLKLKYGLRYSLFQNISNGKEIEFLEHYEVAQTETHARGKIYHSRGQFEPRAGLLWMLSPASSLKAGYTRTVQYIQMASNSTSGSPLDVWFQSSQNVKPQLCDQYSMGFFRNFSDDEYELSVELYYKDLRNVIDFKDHAQLMGEEKIERELRFGKGYAYGMEWMLRKNAGRLNGWLSYTYSRSRRQIDQINEDRWYRSPYDKPHSISLAANFELNSKWSLSANWVYASGNPVTFPTGRFQIDGDYVPIYSGRNEYRYPDYHRLDLSATVQLSPKEKKFRSELNFSLYNAYGRKNPWTIYFQHEEQAPDTMYAEQIYLFSFVPSITWNFTF